jgi:hypothetical protein
MSSYSFELTPSQVVFIFLQKNLAAVSDEKVINTKPAFALVAFAGFSLWNF